VARAQARGYWRKHLGVGISTRWHTIYARATGYDDVRYVPEDVFYTAIEPVLCSTALFRAYVDKNSYGQWLPPEVLPRAALRCVHGRFYTPGHERTSPDGLLAQGERYFIKPSLLSGGARQVEVLTIEGGVPHVGGVAYSWPDLVRAYQRNFIVEGAVSQHPDIAAIHPSSVNTLRITTLRLEKTTVLSTVLRCGQGQSHVDNLSAGGLSCGIGPDGRFNAWATLAGGSRIHAHPDTGYVFDGKALPGVDSARQLVQDLHHRLFYFDLASWDVAIDPDGQPVLIEVNLRAQSINIHQENNGPLFGDRTEEVLHNVRGRHLAI
jgi:hypothetical protein